MKIVHFHVAVVLSLTGWLMPSINPLFLVEVAGFAVVYFIALDWLTVWIFAEQILFKP